MPCCQAASTVAAASSSGMLRNMLPRGAAPKPSGPLINLSLMLMMPPKVLAVRPGTPAQWLTEHPTVVDGPSRSTEPWLPEVINRLELVSLSLLDRRSPRRGDRVRAGPGAGQLP